MRINKNKNNHKKLLILCSIIGIVLISGVSVFAYSQFNNSKQAEINNSTTNNSQKNVNDVNYGAPTKEQVENGNSIKEATVNNAKDTNPTNNLSVSINPFKKDATNYHIEVDIAQVINDGTCTVTLSSQSSKQPLTFTSGVQALSNYSTCKGFDVPLDQLGSAEWSINATVTSGSMVGTATGKTSM